jgi:hypothetical protein
MQQYYPILPYFIPFRAMTNRDFSNLVVRTLFLTPPQFCCHLALRGVASCAVALLR